MIHELFQAIDRKDAKEFSTFLSPDCVFIFGNLPEVTGSENITEFVEEFFLSIDGLSHTISEYWTIPEGLVCHGLVTYTRNDSSKLTVPFANIFKVDSHGIKEYLIFTDTSDLYN